MRWLLPVVSLSSVVLAQTVHIVGPGGFAEIDQAIAAANAGDIVRVAAGTYQPFTCAKSLTIVAVPGAHVEVATPAFTFQGVSIGTAGATIAVRGLQFTNSNMLQLAATHVLGGTVSFDECSWTCSGSQATCLSVSSASVWLRNCSVTIGLTVLSASGMHASNSRVTAIGTSFFGGNSDLPSHDAAGSNAGPAILAESSTLHLVRCTVTGGIAQVVPCFYSSGDGLITDRGERTWLVDSVVRGGDNACGTPGSGLVISNGQPARLTRTSVTAGSSSPTVPAVVGTVVVDQAIGFAAPVPAVVRGSSYRVDYLAKPDATLFVLASLQLQASVAPAIFEVAFAPPGGVIPFDVLSADLAGLAILQTGVPNVPALRDQTIWLHAIDVGSAPFRLAPPVGGAVR